MDERLTAKLEGIEASFDELLTQMANPDVISDGAKYQGLMIRHGELKPLVETFRRYREAEAEIDEAELLAADEQDGEMRDYLQTVAKERREELERLDLDLRRMLVPKDPDADKDVIVELRAAAG